MYLSHSFQLFSPLGLKGAYKETQKYKHNLDIDSENIEHNLDNQIYSKYTVQL